MRNVIKNSKGFSLVELMVVVAIIGILAAIAVPNFQKFAAKSKQSEARTNLSALYSAERAFFSEWTVFNGDFATVGYAPTGKLLYSHGFTGAGPTPPNYTGPAIGAQVNSATYCGAHKTPGMADFCTDPGKGTGPANTPSGVSAAAVFLAGAVADIGGPTTDIWTIDQSKVTSNTQSGI